MSERVPHLPYRPGIDGLRTVAVLAVLLYHADVGWAAGGFLGVDVFLVISGYLITSLLLAEQARTGRLDFRRFWLRRARRLLPAVFLLIAVCLVFAGFFERGDVARLRGDALASVLYVQNWHLVLAHQSYFEVFARPSLLRHLWSLAVEEQFYLLWPPLFALGLAALGRRRLALGVGIAGLVSVVLMAVLFHPGHDPSRVYYGTDTRAIGLLVGVGLAFVWHPSRLRAPGGRNAARVLDVVGGSALVVLLVLLSRVQEFGSGLYRGGFAGVTVVTAVLLGVLAHPSARLGRWLGAAPLRWLGLRSYGIYLWHWPVIAMTRPGLDVHVTKWVLVPLQGAAAVGLAAASYRWVEMPVRRGTALPWLRGVLARARPRQRLGFAGAAAGATVGMLALIATAPAPPGDQAQALATRPARAKLTRPAGPGERGASGPVRSGPVLAVGESVMLRAAPALQAVTGNRIAVDASVARQASDIIGVLQGYRAGNGGLPGGVVVQVGDNGPIEPDQVPPLRAALAGVRRVVFVTVRVPRRWQDPNNEIIRALVEGWPQARIADWNAITATRGDLLEDGIHPDPEGATLYAQVIERALVAP